MSQEPIDIFAEVKKLNFPTRDFIVVGSGILAAKGIRPAYDLDIVVTEELFEKCKSEGWEIMPWTRTGKIGKEWLKKGISDLMLEISFEDKGLSARDLIKDGEIIKGINFLSLAQLIAFKKEYGRQKDFDDIRLVETYLTQTKGL